MAFEELEKGLSQAAGLGLLPQACLIFAIILIWIWLQLNNSFYQQLTSLLPSVQFLYQAKWY